MGPEFGRANLGKPPEFPLDVKRCQIAERCGLYAQAAHEGALQGSQVCGSLSSHANLRLAIEGQMSLSGGYRHPQQNARGRFFDVVDLVNQLETETRNGKHSRIVVIGATSCSHWPDEERVYCPAYHWAIYTLRIFLSMRYLN
ncbi:hypothetical protein NOJ16_19340 [Neorhizobium galegae]|nr:hypothetical protein [Neorhizobium galegae]MCQ1853471.1 hypothetical protein [Neorhizobium galegae]